MLGNGVIQQWLRCERGSWKTGQDKSHLGNQCFLPWENYVNWNHIFKLLEITSFKITSCTMLITYLFSRYTLSRHVILIFTCGRATLCVSIVLCLFPIFLPSRCFMTMLFCSNLPRVFNICPSCVGRRYIDHFERLYLLFGLHLFVQCIPNAVTAIIRDNS